MPEQPLDVTANGFPQGTTKKGIGRLQARYRVLGRQWWQCVHTSPPSDSRTFPSPQKEPPHPWAVPPLQFSRPWRPQVYFLFLWIYLFFTFFCTKSHNMWLVSLNMRFSSFIHVVSCVTASLLYSIIWIYQFGEGRWCFLLFFFGCITCKISLP